MHQIGVILQSEINYFWIALSMIIGLMSQYIQSIALEVAVKDLRSRSFGKSPDKRCFRYVCHEFVDSSCRGSVALYLFGASGKNVFYAGFGFYYIRAAEDTAIMGFSYCYGIFLVDEVFRDFTKKISQLRKLFGG